MRSPSNRPETQSRVKNNSDHQETTAAQGADPDVVRPCPKQGSLNVLVIHEMLPHPDRHGADLQWMQMLQELRAQGHEATHVARSAVNRDRYAARLEQLGAGCLLVLFFLSLLAAWNQETDHPSRRALQRAMEAEESYI